MKGIFGVNKGNNALFFTVLQEAIQSWCEGDRNKLELLP